MKALLFSVLALIISVNASSQDTLFTRNGEVILGKVYEITQTEIKYKKPSNPDGPLYTVSKDDIAVIEYKNGSKDVFQYAGQTANSGANTNSNSNTSTQQPQVNNYYSSGPRPGVNVILGAGYVAPFFGGWGYRPWYRPYRYYGGGGWGWGGYHHGGCGHHGHHR